MHALNGVAEEFRAQQLFTLPKEKMQRIDFDKAGENR